MNGTQDGHAKIYTDWHQLEGASWMASFHAEFFFLLLFIFLIRFVLLLFAYVAWFERDWNKKKDQKKKKENIAFLAFSWIEGFFLLLMVVALYPILFLFIRRIYNNLLAGFILVFIFIVSIS